MKYLAQLFFFFLIFSKYYKDFYYPLLVNVTVVTMGCVTISFIIFHAFLLWTRLVSAIPIT